MQSRRYIIKCCGGNSCLSVKMQTRLKKKLDHCSHARHAVSWAGKLTEWFKSLANLAQNLILVHEYEPNQDRGWSCWTGDNNGCRSYRNIARHWTNCREQWRFKIGHWDFKHKVKMQFYVATECNKKKIPFALAERKFLIPMQQHQEFLRTKPRRPHQRQRLQQLQ